MTSPGGGRLLCRWFAPGLAAGVSRGGNYLPSTYAPLRGWERALARPLGTLMAEAASSLGEELDGVTWVPMSPQKLRRRGYNQSELLAKAVAKELGLPAWDLLEQVRETDTQHNLTRAQRADNVRGAYRAKGAALGKRVLLVDDIVTTGATLRACAQGLYGAGAQKVCAVCAANTAFSRREELPPAEPEEDM